MLSLEMRFLLVLVVFLLSAVPQAGAFVVVEAFINTSCGVDVAKDVEFEKIWNEHPEALILTCHDGFLNEAYKVQSNDFLEPCSRRKYSYSSAHDLEAVSKSLVMVNGRYPANYAYPGVTESAIVMADALDHVETIVMAREDEALNIEFPALHSEDPLDLDVFLYIYAPEVAEDEETGMRVINPVYLMEVLEPWDGGARTVSQGIPEDIEGLSAVIIAQDRDFGGIRAAGYIQNL